MGFLNTPSLLNMANPNIERAIAGVVLAVFFALGVVICVVPDRSAILTDVPAEELEAIDTGDTAWMIVASALVLLMTPGIAFFYGGLVRHKNVVSTIIQCFVCLGLITVLWTLWTFSLAFGDDAGYPGIIGSPSTYGLYKNVGAAPNPALAATIPLTVFSAFQLVFAIITPAIIVGAFTERVNFGALCLFIGIWHILVYCPLAHMVWHPAGLIRNFGVLDFAGGTVVHMSSGYAALVGSLFLGPSVANPEPKEPANVPYVILGTALLWFGWFGFNAGSVLGANALTGQVWITTNAATASAMLTWLLMDRLKGNKLRATGACIGAVVGLVAITPACGFVTVGGAILIGMIGSIVSSLAMLGMSMIRHKVDDSLDVFAAHGVGGTTGMILTSLFATTSVNSLGFDGGFYGGGTLFWKTIVTMLCVVPFICLMSFICFFITNLITKLRVDPNDEVAGLDVSVHGERAAGYDSSFMGRDSSVHGSSMHGMPPLKNENGTKADDKV
jgi:Amt family ammonium transporter